MPDSKKAPASKETTANKKVPAKANSPANKAAPIAKRSRAEVLTALMAQLASAGADKDHYLDLVNDYMRLWDIKNKLLADIRKRGVVYQEMSSTKVMMWKQNQSVKDVVAVERQMLAILSELNITTENAGAGENGDQM